MIILYKAVAIHKRIPTFSGMILMSWEYKSSIKIHTKEKLRNALIKHSRQCGKTMSTITLLRDIINDNTI